MEFPDEARLALPDQSWIVLDENGWAPSSRPSTASPGRPASQRPVRSEEEGGSDDDDSLSQHNAMRRVGMDRDVREALEMAERSLELAGSVDEFSTRRHRGNSEDDMVGIRTSPVNLQPVQYNSHSELALCDPYNGRGTPVIRRALVISTDSEHIAFQHVSSRTGSEAKAIADYRSTEINYSNCDPKHEDTNSENNQSHQYSGPSKPSRNDAVDDISAFGIFRWVLGTESSVSFMPLLFSHALALLAGVYLGMRRSSSACQLSSVTVGAASPSLAE